MKRYILARVLAVLLAITAPCAARAGTTLPGPDRDLFDYPYYKCARSYFVGPAGSDRADGTGPSSAWATLQHANDSIAAQGATSGAGTCVIIKPGLYKGGVHITAGGNAATATGYLVYRCEKMDKCTVTGPPATAGTEGQVVWDQPNGAGSYVMIDGFVLAASAPSQGGAYGTGAFGQGIQLWDGNDTVANAAFSVHHVWIMNSIISGYGQAGINMNDGEYFYVVHNTVHNNANAGCQAQGSGIAFVELKAVPGTYKRTADDGMNHILGDIGSFNNAIAWNVVYNNATTKCGDASNPYDTDGNNIILDTLNNGNIGGTLITGPTYPGSVLVEFNVTYNAGGRGIHIFRSENITVANNSCYNSDLDPYLYAIYRPCIGDNIGYNNEFFNNLAYAIPQPKLGAAPCAGSSKGCLAFNGAYAGGLAAGGGAEDRFFNNISYCTSTAQPLGYGCTPMFTNSAMRTSAEYYDEISTGDALLLSGALPAPLVAGTTYYAVKVGADQIQFAATKADARAVPPVVLGLYDIQSGSVAIMDKTKSKTYAGAVVQQDSFPTTGKNHNIAQRKPDWMKVGTASRGTETTQPVGANFALAAGSPAIGKGLRATYLNAQSVDLGACPSTVTECPVKSAEPASAPQ